jgi:single-strand DNA-binding protein
MPALNRVQIIGNLGKDPETRFTPNGAKVCKFSVAVTERWRGGEGENRERTEWFNIEAWGKLAEICQEYLHKGQLVYLEGRLQTDQYEKNGEKRYFTKIVASGMQMLGRRSDEEDALPPQPPDEDEFPF